MTDDVNIASETGVRIIERQINHQDENWDNPTVTRKIALECAVGTGRFSTFTPGQIVRCADKFHRYIVDGIVPEAADVTEDKF